MHTHHAACHELLHLRDASLLGICAFEAERRIDDNGGGGEVERGMEDDGEICCRRKLPNE